MFIELRHHAVHATPTGVECPSHFQIINIISPGLKTGIMVKGILANLEPPHQK